MDFHDSFSNGLVRRVNQSADSNIGSATSTSSSASQIISTLVPILIMSGIFTVLFIIFRASRNFDRTYAPRTYLGSVREEERSPSLPHGYFNWIGSFWQIPDTFVLNHHSLDGYFFLRFLKIAVVICLVGCFITWPVLFPINITGGNGLKQLDILTFGNVKNKQKFYAHVFVSWIFIGFILYMITRELNYYITVRQAYLLSPQYANRISSRTVLVTTIPERYQNEAKLRQVFGKEVKNIWLCTNCDDVEELVELRDKTAYALEGAETKLIKMATKNRKKAMKKGGSGTIAEDEEAGDESGSIAARWVPAKDRPTHRLKFLIGKKVDTINWSREELPKMIADVEEAQGLHRAAKAKLLSSAFIEFTSQSAAQSAVQSVAHHQPLHMAPRYVGVRPEEVIWGNLKLKWWERLIKVMAVIAAITATVIFWSIPVAFVGSISNINYLTQKLPWLSFINDIPKVILGVVTGLLPSVLLSVLMALLPMYLRMLAKVAGVPTLSQVELHVQNSYFAFQVVQVFLVTTLSSAASAAVQEIIKDPTSVTSLLAQDLPKASNFYLSYMIVQGLTGASGVILQIVGLILFRVLGYFLDSTPRKMYKRWASLGNLGWGSLLPVYTNLVVIAMAYSVIAPLVLGFATIGIFLLYVGYRYNVLFVYNLDIDTRGLIYPRALKQTLVGIYLCEICLIGLVAIKKAIGPLILEIFMLVFTILFHLSLNSAYDPLLKFLPKTLETEEEALLSLEHGHEEENEKAQKNGAQAVQTTSTDEPAEKSQSVDASMAPPHGATKKPNFFSKWLHPDIYCDYYTMRRMVPKSSLEIQFSAEAERQAYYNPAISSETPLLWIPRDEIGISRQEIAHTSKVIPITDELSEIDADGKITFNHDTLPPIYKEPNFF